MTHLSVVVAAAAIFWTCIGLIAYTYVLYPCAIWLLSKLFGRSTEQPELLDKDLPRVSLLVVAHNEQTFIRARVENLIALDYPADLVSIVIASDGSEDATARIVRGFAHGGVRLIEWEQRVGKAAVLNTTVPQMSDDIIVLSDANTMMDTSALRKLVRWFADPGVGVVCGCLVLTDPVSGKNVDSLYWKYETFLKKCEGRLGALLGANGAIYAIRRRLFTGIDPDTIVDDFVIPLRARLMSSCRIVYDEAAIAFEQTPATIADEFRRRARIGAGGFQSIGMLWPLLNPRHGFIAFTFFSHKILRWVCPFFLVGAAATNILLVGTRFYALLLLLQAALYVTALLGYLSQRGPGAAKIVRLTTMFAAINAALLVGFVRWVTGRQRGVWERTAR